MHHPQQHTHSSTLSINFYTPSQLQLYYPHRSSFHAAAIVLQKQQHLSFPLDGFCTWRVEVGGCWSAVDCSRYLMLYEHIMMVCCNVQCHNGTRVEYFSTIYSCRILNNNTLLEYSHFIDLHSVLYYQRQHCIITGARKE